MTKVRPTTPSGRRKLSEEHRAKLSAASKARYERMTPAEKAATVARIGRSVKASGPTKDPPTKDPPTKDPPTAPRVDTPAGGRINPLAMTPRELIRSIRGRTAGGAIDNK